MTPPTPLPLIIEIAPGADLTQDPATWPWVDVTRYWRNRTEITITEGRGDWGEAIDAGTCTLTFDNREGHFSEHNPRGQWYGLLGRDTPLRVSLDRPSGRVVIWGGFVPAWVPSWDMSGKDRTVTVTAHGTLYRLQPAAGRLPARSPLRRAIAASRPVAYWPVEDGILAGRAASALPGHPPLAVLGAGEFAPVDDFTAPGGVRYRFGTSALMDLSGGARLDALMPSSVTDATTTGWSVAIGAQVDIIAASGDVVLAEIYTGGTIERWRLVLGRTAGTQLIAYTSSGAATTVIDVPSAITSWSMHDLSVWQDGSTIRAGIGWAGPEYGWTIGSGSVPGALGGITAIRVNATGATSTAPMQVGHLAVWAEHPWPLAPEYSDQYGAPVLPTFLSWRGEAAHLRLARLCAEDGIPVEVGEVTDSAAVVRMGDQPTATALELYRQCEAADGGVLHERPHRLAYTPREALYNQEPALVLDWSAGDLGAPPQPDPYSQRYRNRVEVRRVDGSSAVAETPEAQTGIVYDESMELNLASDDVLDGHAWWRLHLASHTGLRWPRLELNLLARPEYIDNWLACRVGSRIQVLHPPEDVAGQDIDLMLEGWTLTLGPHTFRVTANCSPYQPWLVGVYDESRYDTAGSELAVAAGPDDTTVDVSTTAGPAWTTDPAMLPLDLNVGGERVTVTAVGPLISDQFGRSVADGWGSAPSGDLWSSVGGSPSNYSVSSGAGIHTITAADTALTSVIGPLLADVDVLARVQVPTLAAGAAITAGVVALRTSSAYYLLRADFAVNQSLTLTLYRVAGGTTALASAAITRTTHSTGSSYWIRLQVRGTQLRGRMWHAGQSEPIGWDIDVVDPSPIGIPGQVGCRTFVPSGYTGALPVQVLYHDLVLANPQRMTVTRAANGVRKPHPAGTPVRLWQPAVYAL